ncbi:MAG: alpha/beta hydrolase family protein [Bdellovibrionota bacterium]
MALLRPSATDEAPTAEEKDSAQLEGDVCPYPRPGTDFSNWERLTLSDRGDLLRVLRLLARKFSWGSLADVVLQGNMGDMAAAIEYYRSNNFAVRPSSFFRRPKELPKVCLSEPYPLEHGEIVDLMFQTHYVPRYKPFEKEYAAYSENQKVHARMWKHPPGQSLGTIVAIHGWFMGDQRVSALTLVPGFFFRLGLDVVLYELPHHGRRAPIGRPNTSLFPSADVPRTNEGFGQAIFELRSLAAWLEQENPNPVGAIGMSLGGYTAALWGSLDKLAFVIPVVPLVSIADMVWKLVHELRNGDEGLKRLDLKGLDLDQLRAIYSVHCPLSYQPKTPLNRRMIIAGLGDPIIPASQPQMLWEHWNKPRIHWFEGGHLGQIVEGDALHQVHLFLQSLKLAHSELLTFGGR